MCSQKFISMCYKTCLCQNRSISRKNLFSFSIPYHIVCRKFGPNRPKILFCMTFCSWPILKSNFQKSSTSKLVFLKTWISDDSTSKRPTKANFRAIGYKFLSKYARSDTEISGAKKEETIFRLMPGFCWLHHKWINISNLFVDYNYYNPEMEYSMSFWITRGLHIRSFSSAWVFQTIRKDFQSNFMLPACARENGRRFPSM